MIDDIGFSDSSASIAVSGRIPRFAFKKTPDDKAISELQIRPKTSIDGKRKSPNRHVEGVARFRPTRACAESLEHLAAAFAVAGEKQEMVADQETVTLLKLFVGDPDIEKARAEFERAQKVEEKFHRDFDGVDFTKR